MRVFVFIITILILSGCATSEQRALGTVWHTGGLFGGAVVYSGDIKKSYRVIKPLYRKERQIPGPNYYDHISGATWMSALGKEVGADAVIHFESGRIKGKNIFDLGWFEAKGVAVKFND